MTTLSTRTRLSLALGAFALVVGLSLPAMANDRFETAMQDAAKRNDHQMLPDQYTGGATFIQTARAGPRPLRRASPSALSCVTP